MITRIEIDGFKSFRNFSVDLRPFQVLIGPNGVGKSNLFDAIVLLSNLAGDNTLYDAFRKNRGDIGELFTLLPDGNRTRTMRFVVEMLIAHKITDVLGATVDVSSTRLHYELEIERRAENGFERLYVAKENLHAITEDDDKWFKFNIPTYKQRKLWIIRGRRSPYISTDAGFIYKHQDGRAGGKQGTNIGKIERTILSTVNTTEYPTVYAARQEMLNWRFLQFNPVELRTPSSVHDKTTLEPDGSNLAAVMWRMERENEYALKDVSIDMSNIVPGILDISVRALPEREEFLIEATTQDGSKFSSRLLSDGTLRLLALVALRNDPQHQGVLCLEEPENGVHPLRLQQIVDVLQIIATNFNDDSENDGEIPRQVLVNTHSPKLMSCVSSDALLFVYMPAYPRETRIAHVTDQMFSDTNQQEKQYTIHEVREILDASSINERRSELEQAL